MLSPRAPIKTPKAIAYVLTPIYFYFCLINFFPFPLSSFTASPAFYFKYSHFSFCLHSLNLSTSVI